MKKIGLKLIPALLSVCVMTYGLVVHAEAPEQYKLNFVYMNKVAPMEVRYVTAGQTVGEAGIELPPVLGLDKEGKIATSWWSSTDNEPVDENYEPKGGTENKQNISIAPRHDHTRTTVKGTPATCVSTGTGDSVVCIDSASACGDIVSAPAVLPVNPNAHSYSEEWDSDADYHWRTCGLCGSEAEKVEHTPGEAPTETEPQRCTECHKILQEALGHQCKNYVQPQDKVEPTCVTAGSIACYVCTEHEAPRYYQDAAAEKELTEEQLVIPATGNHSPVDAAPILPTCTTEGVATGQACEVCDTVLRVGEIIPALGHDNVTTYDDKEHWQACTRCEEETEKTAHTIVNQACTGCDYKQCQAHKPEAVARVEATCTTSGCKEYYKCNSCGQCYEDAGGNVNITNKMDEWVISATGHKEVAVPGTEATCTADGRTDGSKCETCGIVMKEQETISAKGHKEVTVPGTEATCTAEGKTDGSKCEVCGTVIKEQGTIPAKGHTEVTEKGTDATCTTDGKTDRVTCEVCGTVIKEHEVIPAKGHTEAVVSGAAATCTMDGRTDGITCKVCGATVKEQEVIPALGHAYSESWSSDASGHWHACGRCDSKADAAAHTPDTEAEGEAQTCTVCGYKITVPNDHTHQLKLVQAVAASCTQKGVKEHYECEDCGRFFMDAEGSTEVTMEELSIPAVSENGEHTFGEWTVTREATETENGLRERTCSGCGYVEMQEIPATGSATEPPEGDDPTEPPKSLGDPAAQPASPATETPKDGNSTSAPNHAVGVESPETGETQNMAVWLILLSVCGALVWVSVARRKSEN